MATKSERGFCGDLVEPSPYKSKIFSLKYILCLASFVYLVVYHNLRQTQHFFKLQADALLFRIESPLDRPQPPDLPLQFDWTNLEVLSELGKNISRHQEEQCQLPLANYHYDRNHGLGSDLHMWSQAICNGMEKGLRIRTKNPWIYLDETSCDPNLVNDTDRRDKMKASALFCYFPQAELNCPNDVHLSLLHDEVGGVIATNMTGPLEIVPIDCPSLMNHYGVDPIRAAATEYLFTKVSPIVQHEAERQLNVLFGDLPQIPKNLVTVQIRWGDKDTEMQLVPIQEYIEAVKTIVERRKSLGEQYDNDIVSIFLSTEDPKAVEEFIAAAPTNWKVYLDVYYQEMLPHRPREYTYNNNPQSTVELKGKPGLLALGSLLVAMEAKDYVVTTGSNWGRLMNELRQNVLDPRCDRCTHIVDLREGYHWR